MQSTKVSYVYVYTLNRLDEHSIRGFIRRHRGDHAAVVLSAAWEAQSGVLSTKAAFTIQSRALSIRYTHTRTYCSRAIGDEQLGVAASGQCGARSVPLFGSPGRHVLWPPVDSAARRLGASLFLARSAGSFSYLKSISFSFFALPHLLWDFMKLLTSLQWLISKMLFRFGSASLL